MTAAILIALGVIAAVIGGYGLVRLGRRLQINDTKEANRAVLSEISGEIETDPEKIAAERERIRILRNRD